MKKIFLTSGVVLCLACPAFAADTKDLVPQQNGGYLLEGTQTAPNCSTPDTLKYDNAPTTFYAKWQAKNDLVVTYIPVGEDDEGSTTVKAGQSQSDAGNQSTYATYDAPFTVYTNANLASVELTGGGNAVPLSRKGYEFAGWAPDKLISTGGTPEDGFVYAESANDPITKYLVDGNVNLTAQWTPIRYNVVYNKGAHASSTSQNYTDPNGMIFDTPYTAKAFDDENTIATKMWEASGYSFAGWSTTQSPDTSDNSWKWTGTTLNDSVDQDVLDDYKTYGFNVYAIYSADTFTLTYNCGGYENDGQLNGGYVVAYKPADYKDGYSSPESRQVGYQFDAVGAAAEPVTKFCELPGYHSTGWRCTYGNNVPVDIEDITRIETEQGEPAANKWTIADNVTCTAVWEPNNIGLTWDTRNGETATNGSCTYDWGINVPAAPTKAGYNFVGWSTTEPQD